MNIQIFLDKVLELIENPENYTTSWFAKNQNNESVMWTSDDAIKFDLMGAIERVAFLYPELEDVKHDFYNQLTSKVQMKVPQLVDTRSHEEILWTLRSLLDAPKEMEVATLTTESLIVKKKRGRPRKNS